MITRAFLVVVSALVLMSCTVGPDFHTPAAPNAESYTTSALTAQTVSTPGGGKAGKAQHFMQNRAIPANWWYLFHSPSLNELIARGLANSPTLQAAQATLRQTQETMNAQVGAVIFPTVTGQFLSQRQRSSAVATGGAFPAREYSLYDASVNISYGLDLFGGARRELEGLRAQVNYEKFEVAAAYLTLTANIVTTAITAASLQKQLDATRKLVVCAEHQLAIVKKQFKLGGASSVDVLTQTSQLAQTRALLPPLEQSLAETQHALAVLVGSLPSDGTLPTIDLAQLHLPTELPVSLPSELVRQRPDIQAAEALLHVASAEVGVATANLYPQLTLKGSYGWQKGNLSHLFNPQQKVWDYGMNILQPIFAGGSLRANRRAAIAAYDQAAAQYQQTVLHAFQNVADTLQALENDAQKLRAEQAAETAAKQALTVARTQFHLGGASYLSLLTAERQYQQARITCIQAQAARFTDTAALFQALGGGWWNQHES